jgi:hypothetical protein
MVEALLEAVVLPTNKVSIKMMRKDSPSLIFQQDWERPQKISVSVLFHAKVVRIRCTRTPAEKLLHCNARAEASSIGCPG